MKSNSYFPTKLACYTGYFVQAIINNLAPLFFVIFQNEFGVSYSQISWLIMINFATQICVDVLSVRIVPRLGYRVSVVGAHVLSAAGLVMLGVLPRAMSNHFAGMVIPIVTYATGSGLIEVLVSPIIEGLPLKNKSGEMSFLHSFYCWGQLAVVIFTTLAVRLSGSENWPFIAAAWAVIPFINIFAFMKVPIIPLVKDDEEEMKISEMFRNRTFLLCALLMFCSGASEISMVQWASVFAEKSLGLSKLTGDLFGPALFALMMASMRVVYGFVGDRIKADRALTFSAVGSAAAYLTATLARAPMLSLFGCAFCGFSVAVMWPGTLSLAASRLRYGGTAMFAMLAMFGDLGCSFGPWLAGQVSDAVKDVDGFFMDPLKFGLMVDVIFPVIMITALFVLRSGIKKKQKPE